MGLKNCLKKIAEGVVSSIPVVGDIYTIYRDEKSESKAKEAEQNAMKQEYAAFSDEMEKKRKNAGTSKVVYAGVFAKPSGKNLGNEKTLLG